MTSYWQREAQWSDQWAYTPLPAHADVVIVGGGFAGLATAIRLRERSSATVVLLEAERMGFGASGRNAGFLSPLAAPVWLLGARRDPEQAWAARRINQETHDLARWIGEHVPTCELAPAQLAMTGTSTLSDRSLREMARVLTHVDIAHLVNASRGRPGRIALTLDAYTMHPYRLVHGLAEHAEKLGVTLRERTRVAAIDPDGDGALVRHEGGEVTARRVVVCTNAYTHDLDLGERLRALPIHSFMLATPPLDRPPVRDGDFTIDVSTGQPYHRLHHGRLLLGGVDSMRAPRSDDVPTSVRSKLGSLLPVAGAAGEAWSGAFHATPTGLPIIRASSRSPSVILNVGYGGTGVVLSLGCARLAAALALDGTFLSADDARLHATIATTSISVRDALSTVARIAWPFGR